MKHKVYLSLTVESYVKEIRDTPREHLDATRCKVAQYSNASVVVKTPLGIDIIVIVRLAVTYTTAAATPEAWRASDIFGKVVSPVKHHT
ncbi:MAG: hypothetical protein HQL08_16185 [Nitrospirae bacterium]|nr:hypothetical protein [Nitrospirota bacterium]